MTDTQLKHYAIGRAPPCDLDTEMMVIGGMLTDQTCIELALNHPLGKEDFYSSKCCKAYDAIVNIKLLDALDVDLVNVRNKLARAHEFRNENIELFLMEATECSGVLFPLQDKFPSACRTLEDFRMRRELLHEANAKIEQAYDTDKRLETQTRKYRSESLVDIGRWLSEDPPPQREIFEGVLPHGVVAQLAGMGGLMKTQLMMYLMVSAASGLPAFNLFFPERPVRVLGLLAEDPIAKTHERFKRAVNHFDGLDRDLLKDNLHLLCEESDELLELDVRRNVKTTTAFRVLLGRVKAWKPDFIVIDPMNMFYGVDENDNSHNSRWIQALRVLADGATIIFCHHASKARQDELGHYSARGGGALSDGSRWIGNVKRGDTELGKKYDLDVPERYIQFRVTKNSYTRLTHEDIFFTFNDQGELERTYLQQESCLDIAGTIANILMSRPGTYLSSNDICKLPAGDEVRRKINDAHGKVARPVIADAIKAGITAGTLKTSEVTVSKGRPKTVILP